MKTNLMIAVAALAAGAGMGYALAPRQTADASPDQFGQAVAAQAIADVGGDASVAALRARIAELERTLGAKAAEAGEAKTDAVLTDLGIPVEKTDDGTYRLRQPTPDEMRKLMRQGREMWRREHPEEVARFEENMRRMAERRANQVKSRIEFLASIDTSTMSESDKATHDEVQQLMSRREELLARMQEEGLPDGEREQIGRELFETDRSLREKSDSEREILIRQTAEALGFTGDDAETIVGTIGEIIEATESRGRFGGPGGRGGPPPMPPRGGAR